MNEYDPIKEHCLSYSNSNKINNDPEFYSTINHVRFNEEELRKVLYDDKHYPIINMGYYFDNTNTSGIPKITQTPDITITYNKDKQVTQIEWKIKES